MTNPNNYTNNSTTDATAACHRGRFIRCIRCPTSYHQSEYCIAAGSLILNCTQLICPAHFKPIKGQSQHNRVNVTWCFVCCESGDLVGCSRCPAAYHLNCLYSKDGDDNDNDEETIKKVSNDNKETNENTNSNKEENVTVKIEAIEQHAAATVVAIKQPIKANFLAQSETWVCEDCLHGRRPLYGQIVWAKVG